MGILDAPAPALNRSGQQRLETRRSDALRQFHAALANRDTTGANIVFLGDSITEGGQAGTRPARWIARTMKLLRERFPVSGVTGGEGFVPPHWASGSINITAPATISGGSQPADFGYGKRCRLFSASGNKATWTGITGTAVDIIYVKGNSTGTLGISVDGGAVTTYATSSGGTGTHDNGVQRHSLGAAASHTVEISWQSGGGVYVAGIVVYNGDENTGIRMTGEGGHWGWTSTDYADTTNNRLVYLGERVAASLPDHVVIELGTNDMFNNIAPTTTRTNIEAIIAQIRTAMTNDPSFVIVGLYDRSGGPYTYPWSDYVAQFAAIEAADADVVFFDLTQRLPSYSTDSQLNLVADGVHPAAKGHAYWADAFARFIEPR